MTVQAEVRHVEVHAQTVDTADPPGVARVAGICGLIWVVLFIVGSMFLQGESPMRDDPIDEIRQYWVDDGSQYLVGDYVLGLSFMVGFLPFVILLTRVLSRSGGWSALLARLSLFAGVLAIVWGGFAGVFWGALALGAEDFDDATLRLLMELDAYAFSGLLFPIGLFLGAAGASIWMSRILWRWLGVVGIIGLVGSFIGAAWPADGDEEGAIAALGILGFVGIMLFVLAASINLLRLDQRTTA